MRRGCCRRSFVAARRFGLPRTGFGRLRGSRRGARRRKCCRFGKTVKHGRWRRRRDRGRRRRSRGPNALMPAATATATTPSAASICSSRCIGIGRRRNRRGRLLKYGFLLAFAHGCLRFLGLLVGKFRDDGLKPRNRVRSGFADRDGGDGRRRNRNRRTQSNQCFFRFLFPLRAAESLCSCGVPAHGFFHRARFFVDLGKLERNHCVARAFIQCGKLAWGIRARSRLADACLDLSPIAHWPVL